MTRAIQAQTTAGRTTVTGRPTRALPRDRGAALFGSEMMNRTTNEIPTHDPCRVLVVEDEADISALIAYQLTRAGLRVETASDGEQGLRSVHREVPDLLILDRMLPDVSGDEILRDLRAMPATRELPVLLLTAKRESDDRIEGLEMGADDYITKPFSPRELVLRVQALLRRARRSPSQGGGRLLRAGELAMDVSAHLVTLDGTVVHLTPTEFRLLRRLMERAGRTQSRRQLLEGAWDVREEVAERLETRTVDMHIRRMRAKLGEAGAWIETVRGFGYRFGGPGG